MEKRLPTGDGQLFIMTSFTDDIGEFRYIIPGPAVNVPCTCIMTTFAALITALKEKKGADTRAIDQGTPEINGIDLDAHDVKKVNNLISILLNKHGR